MNSYAKAAQSALKYLGDMHPMTQNMNEVLTQATKKIATIIQKTMSKTQDRYKKGMPMTELESLIKNTDFELFKISMKAEHACARPIKV